MIDSELAFNKLGLKERFQIVSVLHVVYLCKFFSILLVGITYILNTHQESKEIMEVSSAVYINMYLDNIYYLINILAIDFLLSFFMLRFQGGFVLTLVAEYSS